MLVPKNTKFARPPLQLSTPRFHGPTVSKDEQLKHAIGPHAPKGALERALKNAKLDKALYHTDEDGDVIAGLSAQDLNYRGQLYSFHQKWPQRVPHPPHFEITRVEATAKGGQLTHVEARYIVDGKLVRCEASGGSKKKANRIAAVQLLKEVRFIFQKNGFGAVSPLDRETILTGAEPEEMFHCKTCFRMLPKKSFSLYQMRYVKEDDRVCQVCSAEKEDKDKAPPAGGSRPQTSFLTDAPAIPENKPVRHDAAGEALAIESGANSGQPLALMPPPEKPKPKLGTVRSGRAAHGLSGDALTQLANQLAQSQGLQIHTTILNKPKALPKSKLEGKPAQASKGGLSDERYKELSADAALQFVNAVSGMTLFDPRTKVLKYLQQVGYAPLSQLVVQCQLNHKTLGFKRFRDFVNTVPGIVVHELPGAEPVAALPTVNAPTRLVGDGGTVFCSICLQWKNKAVFKQLFVWNTQLMRFRRCFDCVAALEKRFGKPAKFEKAPTEAAGVLDRRPTTINMLKNNSSGITVFGVDQTEDNDDDGSGLSKTHQSVRSILSVNAKGGAGLAFEYLDTGWRITRIGPTPGQHGLEPGDIITAINRVSIVGKVQKQQVAIFKQNFVNGASLKVWRKKRMKAAASIDNW